MMAEIMGGALYMFEPSPLGMSQQTPIQTQSDASAAVIESVFPFLSSVYSCQSSLPSLVAAEQELLRAIAVSNGALDAHQKIQLMRTALSGKAGPEADPVAQAGPGTTSDAELESLALKLSSCPASFSHHDLTRLTESGLGKPALVEAVCVIGMAQFFVTLAKTSEIEFKRPSVDPTSQSKLGEYSQQGLTATTHLAIPSIEPEHLKRSSSILREQYGFVPNLFAIQSDCPQIVDAQVKLLDTLLFGDDHLSRVQKEMIVLRLAALNANTYMVTMQLNILGLLGIGAEECDAIVDSPDGASLTEPEQGLLEEVGKLSLYSNYVQTSFNRPRLREYGFTETQVIEAVAAAALTNFLSIIQFGLDPVPDFPPRRVFTPKDLYPSDAQSRPTFDDHIDDPDVNLVAQVKEGNAEIFAELVRRHTRRIFGTLAGILGNVDDARDSTQDVFLKAFQNIDKFQGRSKFSTWIMSIAVNTGMERLRQRRPTESLDDADDEPSFRPRQIRSWVADPEQQMAKAQVNDLVRQAVLRLPEKYRVALLLRDINQTSTEDAAAALNLSVPALKARVLRGRLMLRESLAPYFSRPRGEGDV